VDDVDSWRQQDIEQTSTVGDDTRPA